MANRRWIVGSLMFLAACRPSDSGEDLVPVGSLRIRYEGFWFLLLLAGACGRESQHHNAQAADVPEVRGETDSTRAVFEEFLYQSRLTNTEHLADSLVSCDIPGMTDRRFALG